MGQEVLRIEVPAGGNPQVADFLKIPDQARVKHFAVELEVNRMS